MAEANEASREQPAQAGAPRRRGLPLKAVLIVLAAFGLQVGVVFLVFQLYRPAAVSAAGGGAAETASDASGASLVLVDLGTYNITQFQVGPPVNRGQLSVSLAVSVDKELAEKNKQKVLEQRVWIGQLLDEEIGPLPLEKTHPRERQPLKQVLKAKINERLGADIVREVVLRIQAFGP